ncbi:MAG TPA: glycoside hydrolase family 3 C-terminal domain-containing protein, partial [Streptosporangiaceae bacterium]|nr:glycoside hydrolase family 3 C-terminal domain-containing protein [Streptosporangiaceae bacterium]
LLDPDWTPVPDMPAGPDLNDGPDLDQGPDLDPPAHQAIARRLAEESVVLLTNRDGVLPLSSAASVAVIGPLADDPLAFFGCYSMPRHLGPSYPEAADGVPAVTVLDAIRSHFPTARHARGCEVTSTDTSGFAAAVSLARDADVVIAVIGDVAGMFGRGTSGEGCDVTGLRLPGPQQDLLRALTATGTAVVAVLITGRPYAIGAVADELAAVVQTFFPGEEGGQAIAGVLTGQVVPSGKLPVEMPRDEAGQPAPYLRSPLAGRHDGSVVDPAPLFAFGHGLSYTEFAYSDLVVTPSEIATDAVAEISATIRNTGPRAGAEIVQLYLSDPVAQLVRPVRWLAGFARVPLEPGERRRVTFRLHADRTAFTGLAGCKVIEPGEIGVAIGGASDNLPLTGILTLTGPERTVGPDRVLDTPVTIAHQ